MGIAWRVLPAVGLFVWIGIVIAVAATSSTPSDSTAATQAFVIGGALYFTAVFGGAAWSMRRAQRRTRHALYERLAVVAVDPRELARATRPMFTIGYVYVAFGAIVTACGLIVVAVGVDAGRTAYVVMVAVVVAWAVFGAYALVRGHATAAVVARPLGLDLTGIPRHHVSLFGGAAWTSGATSYAGTRHGRTVSISQTATGAATVVSGHVGGATTPRTPLEMSALTGERPACWRDVEVRREDDAVVVIRRGNGAGGWFLHDLLLAEAVAGSG